MSARFSDEVMKRADEAYSLALIGYEPMDHTQAASLERNRRACAAMRAVLEEHLAQVIEITTVHDKTPRYLRITRGGDTGPGGA